MQLSPFTRAHQPVWASGIKSLLRSCRGQMLTIMGLMIWEKLSRFAGAGYLPRSRCYGHTIVILDLILYEESVSPIWDKSV